MKKFNFYYLISTITLVFMLFMFYQTLQLNQWFSGQNSTERIRSWVQGDYSLVELGDSTPQTRIIEVLNEIGTEGQYIVIMDSLPFLKLKIGDFENEQVLVEIFKPEPSGEYQRLEGCEVLLAEKDSENYTGSTIGNFCGLITGQQEYLVLELLLKESGMSLQIESRRLDDQRLIKRVEYLLERLDL